jgi:uncharacterized protein YggE
MRSLILLLFSSLAFAQLDSNSVTVTASRSATLQPDQAVFTVLVDTPLGVNLTDVVAALQGAGITMSNFTGVSSPYNYDPNQAPMLEWSFALPVSLDKLKDTVNTLASVQQSIAKNNSGFTMHFSIGNMQVSQQLAQSQTCPIADLFSDARNQAQKLASGVGMTAGSVLAMQGSISTTLGSSGVYVSPYFTYSSPTCMVTVKFALK